MPTLEAGPTPSIPHLKVTLSGVEKQLSKIQAKKAGGPDELPARVFKETAHELAPAMTYIFQQSYNTGEIPRLWKSAKVAAIYKKGATSDPSNYRPISLTCITCKVMEHIVLSHITTHLDENNILSLRQHGFRPGLSCDTQLITAVHDWADTLIRKGQVDLVLLDFSKAFDKVAHGRLEAKLSHYGVEGKTLDWVRAFLSDRKQQVVVGGSQSKWSDVASGVPQGSVLGSLLFLVYINDITKNTTGEIRLFADDSILYQEISSAANQLSLQKDIDTLVKWADTWQMALNVMKCGILSITNKKNQLTHDYLMKGEPLARVPQHEYLGVTIADNLKCTPQLNKVASKASRTLGFIRRNLHCCSTKVKKSAYETLAPSWNTPLLPGPHTPPRTNNDWKCPEVSGTVCPGRLSQTLKHHTDAQ